MLFYDRKQIEERCRKPQNVVSDVQFLYSVKTNPFAPVVKTVAEQGLGADAASLNEVINIDVGILVNPDFSMGENNGSPSKFGQELIIRELKTEKFQTDEKADAVGKLCTALDVLAKEYRSNSTCKTV